MAKKYENYSVGDNLSKSSDAYSAWTNDLLRKLVAGKTVIQPGESTGGHRLIESEVVYIFLTGTGQMDVIEYSNHEGGHRTNPSFGIDHKAELVISAGDIVLAEEGDYIKVNNNSDVEQLSYLRIFDSEGARK